MNHPFELDAWDGVDRRKSTGTQHWPDRRAMKPKKKEDVDAD